MEYYSTTKEISLLLKTKIDNPKEQLEKKLKLLNNKKDIIRKAYIEELFTEEEYKNESKIIENQIELINSKVLENSQAEQLNFTIDDILLKRDMDFINKIKLPILYYAFNENWDFLDRDLKTDIIMRYVDEQFKEKDKITKTLTENNTALTLRVKTLNNNIKEKDNEISFLKSKIGSLRNTIEYWKDKFDKLISFLCS